MVLPIMYTATVMPFEIFFTDDATTTAWFSINIGITVVFFLDMVMNINVGIYTPPTPSNAPTSSHEFEALDQPHIISTPPGLLKYAIAPSLLPLKSPRRS